MKLKNLLFVPVLSTCLALAQAPVQTPEEIQQQKNLANQSVIAGAAEEFKTPLKTAEKYYNGIVAQDASEFTCLTQHAIMEWLEIETLTPAHLQRMRDGEAALDKKDFSLVEFRYTADEERPKIVIGYRYNFLNNGARLTRTERERFTMKRTPEGWKIDLMEDKLVD
jgi:hypothetical protein